MMRQVIVASLCGLLCVGSLTGVRQANAQAVSTATAVQADHPTNQPVKRPAHVRRGLDRQTQLALEPVLDRARDRGLPIDALTTKAAEGALRGVPSSRIVAAVRALEERLTTAKLALGPSTLDGDIVAGADALSVGASADILRAVRKRRPDASVAVPLGVLAQLVLQGVSTDRAASIVLQLLDHGATSEQLVALRNAVNRDILAGMPASRALDAQAAHVLAALGPVLSLHPNASVPASVPAGQASGTSTLSGHQKH
jgi:hypothetical protein